jgi:hypothetical protein
MRWFRSRIRLGSRLALFALAIQIVLSFGHVHLDGIAAANPAAAGVVDPGNALPVAPVDKSDGALGHYCPVCALIHLAASALPALPPALSLPARFAPVELQPTNELASAPSPHYFFQARAPPFI